MGASNFNARYNTTEICAFGMDYEEDFQFDDTIEWIKENGAKDGFSTKGEYKFDFEDAVMGDKVYKKVFDDELLNLCLCEVITITGGYYQGAQIDYDMEIRTSGDVCVGSLFDYGNLDDVVDAVVKCYYDDLVWTNVSNYSKWNKGLLKMNEKKVRAKVKSIIEEECDRLNEFCKRNSEVELAVYARFSNGETWYSKVG